MGALIGFIVAGTSAMAAEMIFLAALYRAGRVLGVDRLSAWSLVLLVSLSFLLVGYLTGLLVYLFGIDFDTIVRWINYLRFGGLLSEAEQRAMAKSLNWVIYLVKGEYLWLQFLILGVAVVYAAGCIYALQMAKWILRNPVAIREAQRCDDEDDEGDRRRRRRRED